MKSIKINRLKQINYSNKSIIAIRLINRLANSKINTIQRLYNSKINTIQKD